MLIAMLLTSFVIVGFIASFMFRRVVGSDAVGIEIIDYRHITDPTAKLREIREDFGRTMIWGEGYPSRINPGVGLSDLKRKNAMVILTAPASEELLEKALLKVQPRTIFWFANPPEEGNVDEFIKTLWSICRKVMQETNGRVKFEKLRERLAQTDEVIELGLATLSAQGRLTYTRGNDGFVSLSESSSAFPLDEEAERKLTEEWAIVDAYRDQVRRMKPNRLKAYL